MPSALLSALAGCLHFIPSPNPGVSGSDPPATSTSTFNGLFRINETTAVVNGGIVRSVGVYSTNANTMTIKIVKKNSAVSVDVVVSQSFSHPGGGWSDCTLTTPYIVPMSGSYYPGAYWIGSGTTLYNASNTYLGAASDLTGNGQAVTETTSACPSYRVTYM